MDMNDRCERVWKRFIEATVELCEVMGGPSAVFMQPSKLVSYARVCDLLILPISHRWLRGAREGDKAMATLAALMRSLPETRLAVQFPAEELDAMLKMLAEEAQRRRMPGMTTYVDVLRAVLGKDEAK